MSDSRYTDLGLQPLAGEWRHGRAGRRLKVSNPFDGSLLLEIEQADRDDLDAAYAKAAEVQPAWAALGPSARAAVLYKAVEVFDRRHEEIVDWIIRESGSTRLKAEIEWGAARAITLESASFPARVHGRIVESDVPGKESRVYRSATGVSLAGLTTTALPSARAGAMERWVRCSGKFHGLITPTTPMALR